MAGTESPKLPAPTKRNRNEFVREKIPGGEQVASVLVVLLIAGIGVVIWIKGGRFDPGRYALRSEALKSTAANVEGKASTLRLQGEAQPGEEGTATAPQIKATTEPASQEPKEGEAGAEPEAATSSASKPALKKVPLDIALAGTKPMGETEFYSSDNLFEKIDGRAPAYQGFNVVQLRCRSFSVSAAAGSFVDLYEFRFDNPVDAFGMFAMERDPRGQPVNFAPDGYSGEQGFFFRQGTVYVQVIASDTKPATLGIAKSIADIRAKQLPADDAGLAGRKLPAEGLIAESVAFVPENAQGQAALKDVFQAKYKFDGTELPFFVMVAKPDEAEAAWKSFQEFCSKFGKTENLPDVSTAKIFAAQVFGKWKIVYQRAGEIGGVYDASDSEKARRFIEKYLQGQMQ